VERPVFARGLVIGFSIAAPVGPIGVLCIRRTLADGRTTGLAVGLGAAAADAVYGAIAGFGLTAISTPLVRQQGALRMIGGLFLRYLGVRTFLARPADHAARASGAGLFGAFAATFGPTVANPATILSFVAVFAGLGGRGRGGLAGGDRPRRQRVPGLGPVVAHADRNRRRHARPPRSGRAPVDQPTVGARALGIRGWWRAWR
jgi:LysE type translocator